MDFDRAIELDPTLLDAYMNRGLSLIHQAKDDEAERDFRHYLQFAERHMKDILKKLVQEAMRARQR